MRVPVYNYKVFVDTSIDVCLVLYYYRCYYKMIHCILSPGKLKGASAKSNNLNNYLKLFYIYIKGTCPVHTKQHHLVFLFKISINF